MDVTAPLTIDGLAWTAPDDPALPMYRVIANNRQPVALRDLMIAPVRSGYIGDGRQPNPALIPLGGADAVPGVRVDEVFVPVRDGVARCQLYRPVSSGDRRLPVIVYFHGGGFTVGASEDCDFISRKLAVTNGVLVLSANFRSAPEFMFPTPFDDAWDVYAWVAHNGAALGGDAGSVVVAGDSAGSNFAAAIPLRARDGGVRLPDAVVLLGAFTDFQFERWPSFLQMAPRGVVYDMAFAGFIRGAYVGATPWNHPWISPIEGDLGGYPLAVVVAGTHDPIVDSARAFAARIEQAGGRAVGYFPEGMPHGFYFFPGVHPEENVAFQIVAQALSGVLGS